MAGSWAWNLLWSIVDIPRDTPLNILLILEVFLQKENGKVDLAYAINRSCNDSWFEAEFKNKTKHKVIDFIIHEPFEILRVY